MLRQEATARAVVAGDQIELTALRERRRIAVKQRHGDARVAETPRDALVDPLVPGGCFKRRKENAGNAAFNELFTQLNRLFGVYVPSLGWLGRVAPEEGVFLRARDAGQLAANERKNFNRGQVWNQQTKLARA